MDDNDEIALMFEDELRNLDNFDEDDDFDENFEQLEALGFQLKQQLNPQSPTNDDEEWESMMKARKANSRFSVLEEAVSMHAPSPERKSSDSTEDKEK